MTARELDALAAGLMPLVKRYIDAAVQPLAAQNVQLTAKIAALEQRQAESDASRAVVECLAHVEHRMATLEAHAAAQEDHRDRPRPVQVLPARRG